MDAWNRCAEELYNGLRVVFFCFFDDFTIDSHSGCSFWYVVPRVFVEEWKLA